MENASTHSSLTVFCSFCGRKKEKCFDCKNVFVFHFDIYILILKAYVNDKDEICIVMMGMNVDDLMKNAWMERCLE